jgi:hypothetical protein
MPMSWCELVDAMRERRLAWDGERAWDPRGAFVPVDAAADAAPEQRHSVEEAIAMLPPWSQWEERRRCSIPPPAG